MRSSIENGISVRADQRLRPDLMAHQIVAIERDVERAGRHIVAGDVLQRACDAPRERHAAAAHADQGDVCDAAVSFDDFVSDARERARDAVRVHDYRHGRTSQEGRHGHLFANSQVRG